jgi:Carboxypeptidase regulatory-like domain
MFTRKNSAFCASLVMAALLAIVACKFDTLVNAQTTKATISGTVTDEKVAVVANAKIIARNLDTNLSRETKSDGAGRYRIPELAAGQ